MPYKERKIGIYCVLNVVDGKRYVGSSIHIMQRIAQHKADLRHHNKRESEILQKAWDIFGQENFKFEIIEFCDLATLEDREKFWIKFYNSNNSDFGYNMSLGGAGAGLGCKQTENSKKLKSDANKGRKFSESHNQKISDYHIGRKKRVTKSNYVGITYQKKYNNWAVRITKGKKRIRIGIFKDEIEAALAYNKAMLDAYPDFDISKLNKIAKE